MRSFESFGELVRWTGVAAVGLICGWVGAAWMGPATDAFWGAPAPVSELEAARLEGQLAATVANVVWAFGDVEMARRVLQVEADRVFESAGLPKARTYLRLGLLDPSPDGRRALIALGCSAEPSICRDLEAALRQERSQRLVGNDTATAPLPVGHPTIN